MQQISGHFLQETWRKNGEWQVECVAPDLVKKDR